MAVDDINTPEAPSLGNEEKPKEENKVEKKASKGGKGGKKMFINEDLFGNTKTLEDTSPEDGIAHLRIKADEIGNIPGLIDHWGKELEMRMKAIRIWKQKSFMQKASLMMKKQGVPDKVTGDEIARLHPTKQALEKVKILKRNPDDMMARLELISIVAKSGRDFTVEQYRTFLLEAMIACSFGEWSNIGLQVGIWLQDMYFSKLFYKCKSEAQALEHKIKQAEGKENAFTRQTTKLRKHIGAVNRNMEIIKNYQKQSDRALKDNKSIYNSVLTLDEITELLISNGDKKNRGGDSGTRDAKHMSIIKRASEILLLLRVLPLLKEETSKLSSQLKKLDKNDPIVHYLEAKVSMTDLIFKVGQYQGGQRTEALRVEIQNAFKTTHNHYGVAVKKVGKLPKTKMECAILMEYASLIHYFYKVSKTTLGLYLPKEWLTAIFNKTLDLLRTVEKGAENLIMDIQRDMVDEEIDVKNVRTVK